MDRREFLKAVASLGIAAGTGTLLSAAVPKMKLATDFDSKPKSYPYPKKFWVWTGTDSKATETALKAKYGGLKKNGINGVFLSGGIDNREFEIIKAAGLELHSWVWTTNRGDAWIREHHPDWYMVSRSGKSCFDKPPYVDYYRWISPVIPGVQRYLKEQIDEIASHPLMDGVQLDYVRYPDVILPYGLWSHYGLIQDTELPDYDFCYSEHTRKAFKEFCGRDPLDIKNPSSDQEWLHFRYDSVTNLVKILAKTVRDRGKIITATGFPTPRIARYMVRQDWDKWPVDAFYPQLYASFYKKDLSWIGSLNQNRQTDWIEERAVECIQAATMPVYPGLYMPDFTTKEEFESALKVCKKRGMPGAALFGGVPDSYWESLAHWDD